MLDASSDGGGESRTNGERRENRLTRPVRSKDPPSAFEESEACVVLHILTNGRMAELPGGDASVFSCPSAFRLKFG